MTTSPSGFAHTIRSYRLRAGLSQEELAERAGVSARAVSDMERGLRKNPRPETLRLLADALALDTQERAELFVNAHSVPDDFIRSGQPETQESVHATTVIPLPIRPLPLLLDALIGRDNEVAAILAMLERDHVRLVTLTGPGGVGKTRLAIEVARAWTSAFADGAVFVDLGPLGDANQVLPAIAGPIGVREAGDRPLLEVLTGVIGGRRMLLVLDNFEHLMPAAPVVAALVRDCPNLQIVVTSREPLRVRGEREVPVAPLPVPGADRPASLDDLRANASVTLFTSRASAVRPDFMVTEANAAQVAEICRRLDGLPLAIELAAARIRLLSPAVLLERLAARLGVLTEGARDAPDRQQTLRNTIAWSYDLLSPVEQAVFRRTAVFVTGCTLDGAAAVTNIPGSDPFDIFTSLVEKSLLNSSQTLDGETRFSMLESIRAFGLERLDAHGEVAAARQAHLSYVLTRVEADYLEEELTGVEEQWYGQMDLELEDVQSAFRWAQQTSDNSSLLRLGTAIGCYWTARPFTRERVVQLAAGIESAPDAPAHLQVMSRYYTGMAMQWAGDQRKAQEIAEAALEIANAHGDPHLIGIAHSLSGIMFEVAGDCEGSARSYRVAVDAFGSGSESFWLHAARGELGDRMTVCGDIDEAIDLLSAAEHGYHAIQSLWGMAMVSGQRAHAEIVRGQLDSARELFRESIDASRVLGDLRVELGAFMGLAAIALASGDATRAARIIGLVQREREAPGLGRGPAHPLENERTMKQAREALGEEMYRRRVQEGAALSYDQFLSEVLPEL
jgi:predicted ATPase/transcriptional regulator with XRE-family HTH domain